MKVAVLVTMPHETPENRGRMTKALNLASGLKAGGAEVKLIFGGRGVEWIPDFTGSREHPFLKNYGDHFDAVRDDVVACNFCCKRFGTTEAVQEAGIPIEGEGNAHMPLHDLVLGGWQVIPF